MSVLRVGMKDKSGATFLGWICYDRFGAPLLKLNGSIKDFPTQSAALRACPPGGRVDDHWRCHDGRKVSTW